MVTDEEYEKLLLKSKNQSDELNHLTNETIPKIKEENKELKKLKEELTDALDSSTKKYFDQLDVNADLSETFTKNGAELAVLKVKYENIQKDYDNLKNQLDSKNDNDNDSVEADKINDLNKENNKLNSEIKSLRNEINDLNEKCKNLRIENDSLLEKLNNYDSVESDLKETYSSKLSDLRKKVSSLEKNLSDKEKQNKSLNSEIDTFKKQIKKLKKTNNNLNNSLKEEQSKGFFSKLIN